MSRRGVLLLLAMLPVAVAATSAGDLRMPATLASDPGPYLNGCFGDRGGLAPMQYRFTYVSGTTTEWLPLEESVQSVRRELVASMTVRDGLGRTRTVTCR